MSDLLAEINQHYHSHGRYPKVYVSAEFYDKNFDNLPTAYISISIDYHLKLLGEDWRLE